MAEAADEVEEWVALTQATLGQFVAKPRMLAERLRKPPFRFLFDIVAEVARQTGFGLQELFGGELGMKPSIPGTREEKVSFLEGWISLTSAMLGQAAPSIALVSAQSIVCGIQPELTNYLLQCTAAAGWPENFAPPAPPVITTTSAEEADADQAAAALQAPSPEPFQEAAPAAAAPFQEAAPAAVAPVQEAEQVPVPSLEEQLCPSLNVEQARDIAAGMDFTTALQEYDQMHEEFARTAGNFNFVAHASPEAAADEAAAAAAQAAAADEAAAEARPATGAAVPLEHAAAVTEKVNTEIQRAADLLACIEEGLDEADARIQEKRDAEARRLQEAADAAAREEAEAQEEARQAAEREALKRQAKEEARARRKAEKEAAELAAKFPMSKTSMGQSTRIVCSVGDGMEDSEGGEEDATSSKPEGERAAEGGSVDPMAGCFTDELIGSSSSSKPAAASLGFLNPTQKEASLFERLKGELKDTFVSYLCASMPESLLKKYQPDELIGCLQLLLTELRKCIAEHGLEDVHDEEPTSLAEDLHKEFPNDWLPHLQGASPWSLRQRYDLPELIDTLQGLGQTCFERLTDELGPIAQWAGEESPLRKPPAELPAPVVLPQEDSPSPSSSSPMAGLQSPPPAAGMTSGPWSAALGPAPWDDAGPPATAAPPTRAGAPPTAGGRAGAPPTRGGAPLVVGPPPTAGGPASAEAHLRTVQQTSGGASSPAAPAPVFSAALGPAPWEMDGPSPGPAPTTAARMPTGAGRNATAQRQPAHGAQRPLTQQPPRTAAMQHQGFAVTSR